MSRPKKGGRFQERARRAGHLDVTVMASCVPQRRRVRLTLLQLELLLEVLAATHHVVVLKAKYAPLGGLVEAGFVRTEETCAGSGRVRVFALPAGKEHIRGFRAWSSRRRPAWGGGLSGSSA